MTVILPDASGPVAGPPPIKVMRGPSTLDLDQVVVADGAADDLACGAVRG